VCVRGGEQGGGGDVCVCVCACVEFRAWRYHFFSGMCLGMELTRHGKFGWPDQLRPSTVPISASGNATNSCRIGAAACRAWRV
jgi:hypothetical protein